MSVQSNVSSVAPAKSMSKPNNGINLFKFFCAFLVVGIHTEPFGSFGILDSLFGVITRIAVPYFFVCSAYFYFLKGSNTKKLKNYIKRIFVLYLLWSLIYFVYDIITSGFTVTLLSDFLQDFFLQGYKHFWYLQASIVAIVIIVLLDKLTKGNVKAVLGITIALLFVGLIFGTYFPVFSKVGFLDTIGNTWFFNYFGTRNGFLYAPIYMALGYCYAKGFEGFKIKTSFLMTCCMFILLGLEGVLGVYIVHAEETILWLSVLPLIFFLFDFSRKLDIKADGTFIRKCSTIIYCFHPLFIRLISGIEMDGMIKFFVVGGAALGFAALLNILKKYKPLSWLKYFG